MRQDLQNKASLKCFVLDSQQLFMDRTVKLLRSKYPKAEITAVATTSNVLNQISRYKPNLLVMDISVAEKLGEISSTNTGIQLLKKIMQNYPQLNIVVQSAQIQKLVRIKPEIDAHCGGFTVADKSLSSAELSKRIEWSLQGFIHTKDIPYINSLLQVTPECLKLLNLAFQEGLQDKVIAQHIFVSERMVRHYWDRLQTALGMDGDELKRQGKNLRIITQIRAREVGLID